MPAIVCTCSCPDPATAARIAEALVDGRLAACVQILPGATSVYRWQGKLARADEALLTIKTTRDRFEAVRDRIVALHPYALPEIVAFDVAAGLPAYLGWIAQETAPGAAP